MSDVKISKATDRYSCNLCKSHTSDNLYEIKIGRKNICLCSNCFRKTRMKMYEVSIDSYEGKTESEESGTAKEEISPEKTEEKEWIRESQIEDASAYTDFDSYGIDESDYIGHVSGSI